MSCQKKGEGHTVCFESCKHAKKRKKAGIPLCLLFMSSHHVTSKKGGEKVIPSPFASNHMSITKKKGKENRQAYLVACCPSRTGKKGEKVICRSSRPHQSFLAFSYVSKMLHLNVSVHISISQNAAVLIEICSPLLVPAA